MSGEREDAAAGLAAGLEAADALIESLEEEVTGLRLDLESATAALRSAQREVAARASGEHEAAGLRAEISALKRRHSDEQLRMSNEHIAEVAAIRRTLEEQRRAGRERAEELEGSRDEEVRRRVAEEISSREERHEAALRALKGAAAGRELGLRKDYQAVVETQQAEIESLRREAESREHLIEEARREERRQAKAVADDRERDLRHAQATGLAEARQAADRQVTALQAQREADKRALRARHAEKMAATRREYEQRLAAEDERRRSETWALEERLREADIRRQTERRAYGARMKELETRRLAEKAGAEKDREAAIEGLEADLSASEDRISALQEALEEAGSPWVPDPAETGGTPTEKPKNLPEGKRSGDRAEEIEERRTSAERIAGLEARLLEATEEARRNAEEREAASESLRRLSDPERRLREGLVLFNESEHTRAVASISRSFGLPKVHAGLDGGTPGKPTLTLLWDDVVWRRYVSDPTEGVPAPRVYLTEAGDDPSEVPPPERRPNARMDARGRLMLGVQAR